MQKNFIIVNDKSTADQLIAAGFILLSQFGDVYTFKNDQKNFNFSNIEQGKIHYTNVLSL